MYMYIHIFVVYIHKNTYRVELRVNRERQREYGSV